MNQAVIAGVSSGIGSAIARHLKDRHWTVSGTSRSGIPPETAQAVSFGVTCDFAASGSVDAAAAELVSSIDAWDLLVLTPGSMLPIGNFTDTEFEAWIASVDLNLLNQLRFVHRMLPYRRIAKDRRPLCLFLAGGGVNSAPLSFSAYTVSKVALIKATELLDAEEPDVTFTILGPGWIRTRIHEETLASERAPDAIVRETLRRLETDDFLPMSKVLDAVDWLIDQPKEIIGGRNFSAGGDPFEEEELTEFLAREPSAFRLRRAFNSGPGAGRVQ